MNSVQAIMRSHKILTFQEKLAIKALGPDRPNLVIEKVTKTEKREYSRKFNNDIYNKYKWLCGCDVKNALFCFPCLIFSFDVTVWTSTGFTDLAHLSEKLKKHENSHSHKNANIELSMLGRVNISTQLAIGIFIQINRIIEFRRKL